MSHLRVKPKRNKTYRPKPVSLGGGLIAIDKHHQVEALQQPIPAEHATDLLIAYWLAFDQMLTGASSEETWCTVVCSLNVALILAERGTGTEYEPYIIRALEGAFRASVRARRTNTWRFDGEAITDIRQALEVHDEQVKAASKAQMRDALMEVHRRINKGNVYQVAA